MDSAEYFHFLAESSSRDSAKTEEINELYKLNELNKPCTRENGDQRT